MDYLNVVYEATQFIHDNYDENILSDIAEYVYLSPSYFSNVFRILTNYTVKEYVSTLSNLPSGLIARRFDSCDYAVFETTLAMEDSGDFWRYFFKTWLPEQGLQQPETTYTKNKNTYSKLPSFEVYDESFKDLSSTIKIYAPIIRK